MDYNFEEKEEKQYLKRLKMLRKEMKSGSLRDRIDLWIKMYHGDLKALCELSVIAGQMTQEDCDGILYHSEE